jgi:hypothetical protein
MKNKFLQLSMLALTAGSLFLASCSKEESSKTTPADTGIAVSETNTSVINKYTGSKCGPCGSWGWDMAIELIDYSTKACYVGTFSQNFVAEEFISPTASAWDDELGVTGYPTFAVNHVLQLDRSSGVNTTSEKAKCKAAIDAHSAAAVQANVGFTTSWSQDAEGFWTININSRTKFFKENSGDYYVGCYLLENKAIGKQSGHTPSVGVEHHHVLRQTLEGLNYGYLAATNPTSGKTIDKTYTTIIPKNYIKDNMEVLFVIWKKTGSKYTFVNASTNQK